MLYSAIFSGGAGIRDRDMHKSRRNPLSAVVFAVIIFAMIAVMPIYCNRDNEAEHVAAEEAAAAAALQARDAAAAGDLVDTDAIAEKEGFAEPDGAERVAVAEDDETFVPDRSKLPISYRKTTPRPAESMIHSTESGVLETHGNFDGMEESLASLNGMLTGFYGKISVVAYALDGSRSLTFNSDYDYMSQCTIKASYVYSLCLYMDANAFDENTVIVYNASDFVEGSGSVKNNAYGTGFTVRDLVIRCLSISDNTAYKMLLNHFGNELRNECMKTIGAESLMTVGMWGTNVVPEDYVILWDEIYNYIRTNSHYAQLLKESCTNTPFAYAKPTNGLDYSHKSGDGTDWGDCHDVCLVWDDVPYVVAIFTRAASEGGSHPTIENVAWIIHERLF